MSHSMYAGTAVTPPPEFVLADGLNQLAVRLAAVEEQLAVLQAQVGSMETLNRPLGKVAEGAKATAASQGSTHLFGCPATLVLDVDGREVRVARWLDESAVPPTLDGYAIAAAIDAAEPLGGQGTST